MSASGRREAAAGCGTVEGSGHSSGCGGPEPRHPIDRPKYWWLQVLPPPEIRTLLSSARSTAPSTDSSFGGVRGQAGGWRARRRAGHLPVLWPPVAPTPLVAARLFATPPPCQNFYPYLSSPSHSEECGGGGEGATRRGTYRGRWWRRSELGRPGRKSLSSRACLGEATGCGIALFLSRSLSICRCSTTGVDPVVGGGSIGWRRSSDRWQPGAGGAVRGLPLCSRTSLSRRR